MISSVRSNMPSFKAVEFTPGFNVILADRTKESMRGDSRNGLGKTTLFEIVHFCLGAGTRRNRGLLAAPLKGWTFTLELQMEDRSLAVTRSTDQPNRVQLQGDVDDLADVGEHQNGGLAVRIADWNTFLGEQLFGISPEEHLPKYQPTFRSLFSYLVRRDRDAFSSPFNHHRRQSEWDKQVNNAFLLDLAWQHASELQELKDNENALNGLRRAARDGLLQGLIGNLGNLEAERTRLDTEIRQQSGTLQSFRVHPQYAEIEEEVNELTSRIQQMSNANITDGRLVDLYSSSLEDDQDPDTDELLEVYQEVGVTMPDMVRRRLEEVQDFHRQIVANRRTYLQSEIQRIESGRSQRGFELQAAIERRAQLLEVLQTHGALQEFTALNELHLDLVSRRNDVDNRISNLQRFEQGRSEVRVSRELLLQTARRDFEERREARATAINLFNSNSQALYSAPGNLVVNIADTGFTFDVDILRSGSQGINNMKIFCYDLMLAQLWATKQPSPRLLMHDSTIFDGVDERQIAQSLELAHREAENNGFQYVCALNSDTLPSNEFSPTFDLESFVRLHLTDESEEGGLLGIRY